MIGQGLWLVLCPSAITSVTFSGLPAWPTIAQSVQRGSWMGCGVFWQKSGTPMDAGLRLASGRAHVTHALLDACALARPNIFF
jgi:hypothetical protein